MAEPQPAYEFHPLAGLFPLLDGDEFRDLAADIAANGLLEPIWLYEGQILDGRNRYVACLSVDATPTFRTYSGADPIAFVVSENVRRRHLTPSQLVPVALAVERAYAERARARQGARLDLNIPQVFAESERGEAREQAAAQVGVNRQYISDGKMLEREAPDLLARLSSGMTVPQAKRELKERRREARRDDNRALVAAAPDPVVATTSARFATIVIDPPWDWGDEGDVDQFGRARPTYGTMPLSDIEALPVADMADVDCHLYLWITNRSLPKGFRLLEAWGFRYVTCLTWCKPSIGMGNYYRGSTEHVLFGVRGSQPLRRKDVGTWFAAPRAGQHSAKPPAFADLVESCSPGPYLEMFARSGRMGWASWGAEAPE